MISKLPHVGTTIFTQMSKLALDHGAINLAQGFPNFPVDPRLLELLRETSMENSHQYAPMAGNPLLIEQIIRLTEKHYKRRITANEVLITAGATQGIFTAIQALVFQNDEVIIIDPAYDCYRPALDLVGAKSIHVSMQPDFTIDWNQLEGAVNERTKMLIINNPHNPSGKILTAEDFAALQHIVEKYPRLLLLSDEVYEYISFDVPHRSVNSFPLLAERSIVVSSFGKTFHITGWKVGYLIAPENILNEIKKVHQFLVFSVNSVAQLTLAKYLQETDVSKLGAFYKTKRDYFRSLIEGSKFKLLPSEGTYFQVLSYEELSSRKDTDFVLDLVQHHGVAAIPMSVFYESEPELKLLRFCFAKDHETLEKAAEKLCKI